MCGRWMCKKILQKDFNGLHYVECYIVKNGICLARSRIMVPINVGYVDREHLLLNG